MTYGISWQTGADQLHLYQCSDSLQFARRYWNILKHTHLHCFFFRVDPHIPPSSAWRTGIPQPEVVCGFGHPLLGPLLKIWGGIFTVLFQHWLPQHVHKRTKGPLIHPETAYWKMPPSDVKRHSTKTSLRKPSSFTDVSDFVKNSGTYDRLKAS